MGTREPRGRRGGAGGGAGRPRPRPGCARWERAAGLGPPRSLARSPASSPGCPGVAAAAPSIVRGRGGGGGGRRGSPCVSPRPPAAPPPASAGTGDLASPVLARAGRPSLAQYLRSRCPAAPASAAEVPPPPSLNSAALSTASGLAVALLPEESPSSWPLLGNAPSDGIPSGGVTCEARCQVWRPPRPPPHLPYSQSSGGKRLPGANSDFFSLEFEERIVLLRSVGR